jgi:hypothetical protein
LKESFAPENEWAGVGIKWGGFMFFVGASNTGNAWRAPTFAEAFAALEQRIGAGLNFAHAAQVTLYRPQ